MDSVSKMLADRGVTSVSGLARLVVARFIYREIRFVRTGITGGESYAPDRPHGLTIEVWGEAGFERAAAANPFIRPGDLDLFRSQPTRVAVALDGEDVVGQIWGTTGELPTDEIGQRLRTESHEVYTCRGVVAADYNGRSLLSHLLHAICTDGDPATHYWDLIRDWNTASLISVRRHGRHEEGRYRARFIGGRPSLSIDRYAPRPIQIAEPGLAATACVIVAEQSWGSPLRAAEALHREGVDVAIAVLGRGAHVYRTSRHCSASADFDEHRFSDAVSQWATEVFPDARVITVIPTSDRTLELVARAPLGAPLRAVRPEDVLLDDLVDKRSAFCLAERIGLDVPAWAPVDDAHPFNVETWTHYPATVRPTAWETAGSRPIKIARCDSAADLERVVTEQREAGAQLVIQEFVAHREGDVSFAITWTDGKQHSICTGRKRRESHRDGGVMVWGIAETIPEIRDQAAKFLSATGVVGPGGLEFIWDGAAWRFIEYNPRLEAIQFLADAAGQNTVLYEHRRLAGLCGVEVVPEPKRVAAWIGSAAFQRLQSERSVALWLKDRWAVSREPVAVKAIWRWSDPQPGLAVMRNNVQQWLSAKSAGPKHLGGGSQ